MTTTAVRTETPYETWARALFKAWPDSVQDSGEGYEVPGPTHADFIFDRSHSTYFVSGGERGAKSWTTAAKCALSTIEFITYHPQQANGKVAWVVAETYDLTNVEMVECLYPFIAAHKPGTRLYKNNQHHEIEIPTGTGGSFIIRTKSALDPESLRAEAPVWVLICEAALLSEDAYFRLRGRLGQIRGQFPGFGMLIAGGTFEGADSWYPTLWTKYQNEDAGKLDMTGSYSLPSEENPFAWPGGANNPELIALKRTLPPALWLERHMAIPAPPTGRVHDRFDVKRHIKICEYDPALPIYIGNDPGYAHPNAVVVLQKKPMLTQQLVPWFQWQMVDQIYETQMTVEQVCRMAMQKFWWKNPQKTGTIDIAGKAHAGQQEPYAEIWQKITGLSLISQYVRIQPGIDRFNTMLEDDPVGREPRFVIDPRCTGLIGELGGGPNPFDHKLHVYSWHFDRTGVRSGKVPLDEYNDAVKAVTYLFVREIGYAESNQGTKRRHVRNLKSKNRY